VDVRDPNAHRDSFANTRFPQNCLASVANRSDESTCANHAQKGFSRTMTKTKADTTETVATVAEQGAHVAPDKASSKKAATPKKGAPKGPKAAKAKPQAAAPKKGAKAPKKASQPASTKAANTPRAESKGARILELIRRNNGATLGEIMKATDWQAHSVRGFLSTAGKKRGIKIQSAKNEAGERVYSIAK
jgi:hypothetical protein